MACSPAELQALIADVLEEVAGVSAADVLPEKSLVDDLDLDSLAMVEVMVELEVRTGVNVSDGDAKKLVTVQDVIDYLTKKGA